MIKPCLIFTSEEELQKLTRLNHEDLWNAGFNLDDWDIGFCLPCKLTKSREKWLLNQIENYCVGYELVEYQGFYYYMIYHA